MKIHVGHHAYEDIAVQSSPCVGFWLTVESFLKNNVKYNFLLCEQIPSLNKYVYKFWL